MTRYFRTILGVAACFLPAMALAQAERTLERPSAFAGIADSHERSVALFKDAGKVLQNPRCVNCHPAGDRPLQGNDEHLHEPPVRRGLDGHGVAGLHCTTCYQAANFDAVAMPGHPDWHLAPLSMAWQGRSLSQTCEQLKDPARNGGRSPQQILAHLADDPLVGWAWSPGFGREPAPGTQKELAALIEAWLDTGAVCPK